MKTLRNFLLCLAGLAMFTAAYASAAEVPKAGSEAPRFEAQDQSGKTWSLKELQGKKAVLLYFYPKDDTPGCTAEACGLRDRMGELQTKNVQVLGASFDNAESHKQFIEKHQLNFPLLVDTEGKLADQFGVRMPDKKMARRVSFLIDKTGKIVHVTDSPSAAKHLEEMKAAVDKLQG
jgi:peroxiredoxin Q/BCP